MEKKTKNLQDILYWVQNQHEKWGKDAKKCGNVSIQFQVRIGHSLTFLTTLFTLINEDFKNIQKLAYFSFRISDHLKIKDAEQCIMQYNAEQH